MFGFRSGRFSPALVVSLVALVLAASGGAWAASDAPRSSGVQGKAAATKKGKTGKTGKTGPAGPRGARGSVGPQGVPGGPGPAGAAGERGPAGEAGRSALTPLRSGETISGVYAVGSSESGSSTAISAVPFPIPAPTPVDSLHVVIAGNDTVTGDGCTGTAAAPVAAPGYVCMYFASAIGTTSGGGLGGRSANPLGSSTVTGDGTVNGFLVRGTGTGTWSTNGVWIYRAP